MKICSGILYCAAPILLLSAPLTACSERLPSYRYKLSVIVDTPEGRRAGFSVVEVRSKITPDRLGPGSGGLQISVTGEAVSVPLPGGRYLFATMKQPPRPRNQSPGGLLSESFADQLSKERAEQRAKGDDPSAAALIRAIAGVRGQRPVPRNEYPIFAYFQDRAEASSVRTVAPEALSSAFGPGYRFVGMTVEITSASVTSKIRSLLPWLRPNYYATLDRMSDGKAAFKLNEAQLLEHADFAKGANQ